MSPEKTAHAKALSILPGSTQTFWFKSFAIHLGKSGTALRKKMPMDNRSCFARTCVSLFVAHLIKYSVRASRNVAKRTRVVFFVVFPVSINEDRCPGLYDAPSSKVGTTRGINAK